MFSEVTCSSELLYYVPLVQISLLSRATTLRTRDEKSENQSGKVEKFLLSPLDLISSPSPSMKIKIVDGKIIENLGFESPLR